QIFHRFPPLNLCEAGKPYPLASSFDTSSLRSDRSKSILWGTSFRMRIYPQSKRVVLAITGRGGGSVRAIQRHENVWNETPTASFKWMNSSYQWILDTDGSDQEKEQ
ncbi:MAG TPA: hypothetical protein VGA35_11650, partial [bacterium]